LAQLRSTAEARQRDLDAERSRRTHAEDAVSTLENENSILKRSVTTIRDDLVRLETEHKAVQQSLREWEETLRTESQRRVNAESQVADLQQQLDHSQHQLNELTPLKSRVTETEQRLVVLHQEVREERDLHAALRGKFDALGAEAKRAATMLGEEKAGRGRAEEAMLKLDVQVVSLDKEATTLRTALEQASRERDTLAKDLLSAQQGASVAKERITTMSRELEMSRDSLRVERERRQELERAVDREGARLDSESRDARARAEAAEAQLRQEGAKLNALNKALDEEQLRRAEAERKCAAAVDRTEELERAGEEVLELVDAETQRTRQMHSVAEQLEAAHVQLRRERQRVRELEEIHAAEIRVVEELKARDEQSRDECRRLANHVTEVEHAADGVRRMRDELATQLAEAKEERHRRALLEEELRRGVISTERFHEMTAKVGELERALTRALEEGGRHKVANEAMARDIVTLEAALKELRDTSREVSMGREEAARARGEIATLRSQVDNLSRDNEHLSRSNETLQRELREAVSAHEDAGRSRNELESLRRHNQQLTREVAELRETGREVLALSQLPQSELQQLRQKVESLSVQNEKLTSDLATAQRARVEIADEIEHHVAPRLSEETAKRQMLSRELETLKRENEQFRHVIQSRDEAVGLLEQENKNLKRQLEVSAGVLDESERTRDQMMREMTTMLPQLERVKAELHDERTARAQVQQHHLAEVENLVGSTQNALLSLERKYAPSGLSSSSQRGMASGGVDPRMFASQPHLTSNPLVAMPYRRPGLF